MIENMEEFLKERDIEIGYFTPEKDFNKGIIGITEDNCHFVYSFEKLAESLAESYKQYESENPNEFTESKTDRDYYIEAVEWLDYNTIRSLPYFDEETRPIIMYEV